MSQAYKVLVGLSYGPDPQKRAEPGETVADLERFVDEAAIAALVAQGVVEAVAPGPKAESQPPKAAKPAKKEA